MSESPHQLIREQVQHLRALAAGLAARALSGDRQVIDNLLVVQHQLLELTHYLSGQQVEPAYEPTEAPPPMDMTPFRVPAPPLYSHTMDELPEDGQGQPSVTLPPAPWEWEQEAADRESEEREPGLGGL